MLPYITAFALVIAVAACGVGVLTISACADGVRRMDSMQRELTALAHAPKTTHAALSADLDDLRGALDTMRASNRKEFGSLWGRLGGRPRVAEIETIQATELSMGANDSSFEAMLALQASPPSVKPQ
jgi:hypothetical protein